MQAEGFSNYSILKCIHNCAVQSCWQQVKKERSVHCSEAGTEGLLRAYTVICLKFALVIYYEVL
jgi:hypothetical protein